MNFRVWQTQYFLPTVISKIIIYIIDNVRISKRSRKVKASGVRKSIESSIDYKIFQFLSRYRRGKLENSEVVSCCESWVHTHGCKLWESSSLPIWMIVRSNHIISPRIWCKTFSFCCKRSLAWSKHYSFVDRTLPFTH